MVNNIKRVNIERFYILYIVFQIDITKIGFKNLSRRLSDFKNLYPNLRFPNPESENSMFFYF